MPSERSVEQKCEPMDKNQIRGLRCRASGRMTTKSTSIKGAGGKSGGCAWKAVELTSGGLPSVAATRLRKEQFFLTRRQKSAAGVVLRETGGRPKR